MVIVPVGQLTSIANLEYPRVLHVSISSFLRKYHAQVFRNIGLRNSLGGGGGGGGVPARELIPVF